MKRYLLYFLFTAALSPGLVPPRANENTIEYDTSVAGQIVPSEETLIQVRGEDLKIRFESVPPQDALIFGRADGASNPPPRVEVTARYRLFNPSPQDLSPLIAFPILWTGPEDKINIIRIQGARYKNQSLPKTTRRGVRSSVAVDGKNIAFEYVSFESLFEKDRQRWAEGVRTWVAQWPAISKVTVTSNTLLVKRRISASGIADYPEGQRSFSFTEFLKREKTGENNEPLLTLLGRQLADHPRIEDSDLDVLSFLYAATHPAEEDGVAQFQERWGVESFFLDPLSGQREKIVPLSGTDRIHYDLARLNRRIDFLQYRPVLPAGKETVIEVRYSHLLDVDMDHQIAGAFAYQFQYILRTSPKWKTFGPIRLTLEIPCFLVYSISLPVAYKGEGDRPGDEFGYDHFIYEVAGSEARENLLIALTENRGFLPGDPHPKQMSVAESWQRYEADPKGPFADDLLYRLGMKAYSGELSSEDAAFLRGKLGQDAAGAGKGAAPRDLDLGSALLYKIHQHSRCYDGRLMVSLMRYAGRQRGDDNYRYYGLQSQLARVQKEERTLRWNAAANLDRWGFSGPDVEAKKDGMKRNIQMGEKERLLTFLHLCDTYMAGAYPKGLNAPPDASRSVRFKALMAEAELDMRLSDLPRYNKSFHSQIGYNPSRFLRFWSLYALYRDVPESADLLRVLASTRAQFDAATRNGSRTILYEDIARMVDEEVKQRGVKVPPYLKKEDFPEWLGVDER
jgi:hypothetical protein